MEEEINTYFSDISKLLNGQLRGPINKKAREENLELIQLTISDVFEKGYNLGKSVRENENNVDKLKSELGIKPEKDDDKGS